MKNKIYHALMDAMGICILLTGTVLAATYTHIGPGSTVGEVNVSTSSYITTSSYSFFHPGEQYGMVFDQPDWWEYICFS